MIEGLEEAQLTGALEALLFVTDEPVSVLSLAEILEVEPACVEEGLVALQQRYSDTGAGIELLEVAGGWRLFTSRTFHNLIERYVISWDARRLSQAALETLAIVAYAQPITRAGVAVIRGVNSDSSLNSLLEKGLVREAGSADAPGNPMQFATTRYFLERFGFRTLKDLPDISAFAPDEETKALIRQRLSDTSYDAEMAELEEIPESRLFGGDEVPGDAQDDGARTEAPRYSTPSGASWLGVTDKVDFDALVFDTEDDEEILDISDN